MKKYIIILALIISTTRPALAELDIDNSPISPQLKKELNEKIGVLKINPELPNITINADLLQLGAVNKFVNSFKYRHDDLDTHWKTPAEFFKDGGGDCKDFAVVKYHYLKKTHDVKIMVGKLYKDEVPHAALLVDDKYVLDNRFSKIMTIEEYKKIFDIFTYFTANGITIKKAIK